MNQNKPEKVEEGKGGLGEDEKKEFLEISKQLSMNSDDFEKILAEEPAGFRAKSNVIPPSTSEAYQDSKNYKSPISRSFINDIE